MVPPFDGGDDFVWVLGPSEGFRVIVGFDEKAVDRRLKLDDGSEHAAFEAPLGQFGEEAFDCVEPGCGSWGEAPRPWQTKLSETPLRFSRVSGLVQSVKNAYQGFRPHGLASSHHSCTWCL